MTRGSYWERWEAFLRRRAWDAGERRVCLGVMDVREDGRGMRPRERRVSLRVREGWEGEMWWGCVVMGVGGVCREVGEMGDWVDVLLLWLKVCLVVGEVESELPEVLVLAVPTLGLYERGKRHCFGFFLGVGCSAMVVMLFSNSLVHRLVPRVTTSA